MGTPECWDPMATEMTSVFTPFPATGVLDVILLVEGVKQSTSTINTVLIIRVNRCIQLKHH